MKQRRSSTRSKTGTNASSSRGSGTGRRNSTASRPYAANSRTVHGRYSDFEINEDRPRSSFGESRARRGSASEYSSSYDQDYYGERNDRSPRRSINEDEQYYSPRNSVRSRGYVGDTERGYMDRDYEDQSRMTSSRGGGRMTHRGYNDQYRQDSDRDMERRYSSGRNENFREIDSEQDEDFYNDDYGFRERYDENRY